MSRFDAGDHVDMDVRDYIDAVVFEALDGGVSSECLRETLEMESGIRSEGFPLCYGRGRSCDES